MLETKRTLSARVSDSMRWLNKRKLELFRGQTGFTLIETLAAVGIIAAIGVGFLTALDTSARTTQSFDEKVTASNLATAYIEAIRDSPYDNTPPVYSNAGDDINVPFQYSVDIDTDYSSDGTTWWDDYSSSDHTLQRITVTVSREGTYILSVCTFRAER